MARKRRDEDDEDEDVTPVRSARDDDDDDDDDMEPVKSGPGNDAYTGLLAIALVAMIGACLFFFLDHSELSSQQLTAPAVTVPSLNGR